MHLLLHPPQYGPWNLPRGLLCINSYTRPSPELICLSIQLRVNFRQRPLNDDICDDNHIVADLWVPVGKGDGAVGHVMMPLELSPAMFRLVEFLHLNINMFITLLANYKWIPTGIISRLLLSDFCIQKITVKQAKWLEVAPFRDNKKKILYGQ